MSYPFVPAANDYGRMSATPLALIIHMAEGGGTVGYLARNPARGVSVHFVIEYSGRIVQMLAWDHAAGSVNPGDIRPDDDLIGPYGISSAVAVMGSYAHDPNAASWSVEIEGFAKDGPNGRQTAALVALVDDCRRRAGVGLLAHRDFQDYKPCPGHLIPWPMLGGHGAATSAGGNQPPGDDMRFVNANGANLATTRRLNVSGGSSWLYLNGDTGGKIPGTGTIALPWVGKGDSESDQHVVELNTGTPYSDADQRPTLVLVRSSNQPYDVAGSPVDCDDVVKVELDKAAVRASDAVKARS